MCVLLRLLFCLGLVLPSACATVDSISEVSTYRGRVFHLPGGMDRAVPQLVPVLSGLGMRIESQRTLGNGNFEVIASRPMSALSWGELVRVQIVSTPRGADLVIYTARVLATNLSARDDWAQPIYQMLVNEMDRR